MMTNQTKKTKKDYFEELRYLAIGNMELTAFIDKELELLARKKERNANSTKKLENEELMSKLYLALKDKDELMTIGEMQAEFDFLATFQNQKVSYLLTSLVREGKVERVKEKSLVKFRAL